MLFDDSYRTIEAASQGVYKDRGSRFQGLAFPVQNESETKEILNSVKREHPKANHHCYAFRLGPDKIAFRFSDDREPSGTAGKPIFGVIQTNDLTNILIIVVRYFGGTLLGVPGLINAYRSAAAEAVKTGKIITTEIMERYSLNFAYEHLSLVMEMLRTGKAYITSQEVNNRCIIKIELSKNLADALITKIASHYILKDHCEIKVI